MHNPQRTEDAEGSEYTNNPQNMSMPEINKIEERILLYEGFIRDGKVSGGANDPYPKNLAKAKALLSLIENNHLTPEIFDNLQDRDKWDVSKCLKDVMWVCGQCGLDQGTEPPKMQYTGELCCSECDHTLTHRTNGGQSDPFNYSFKPIDGQAYVRKEPVREEEDYTIQQAAHECVKAKHSYRSIGFKAGVEVGFVEGVEWLKQQGYTITKKI